MASDTCTASSRVGTSTRATGVGGAGHDALEDGQRERRGLAGAGGGLAEQVSPGEDRRDGLGLDGRGLLVAEGVERPQGLGTQAEAGEGRPEGLGRRGLGHGHVEGGISGQVGHWGLHVVSRATRRARGAGGVG
jgi:hypothetical protein